MVGMARRLRNALRIMKDDVEQPGPVQEAQAQAQAENAYRRFPVRADRIFKHFWGHVQKAGITSGHVVEIGGRANPVRPRLDPGRFRYTAFDLEKTDDDTVVADITNCPQIPDGFCDVVVSIDVFEHIDRPWLAAQEIARILKPGGICYTSTLFSWRYHPCPIDFWRFTPAALTFLFDKVDCINADFDATERRRNILGRDGNRIAPDAFGGWRENWRVYHVGQKPR